jgi:hypothetical protein
VGGRDDGPQSRLVARHGGKTNALRENTLLKQPVGHLHRFRRLADDHRRNGTFAPCGIEPERLKPCFEEPAVVPQLRHPLRLVLEHIQRRDTCCRDRGRVRRREQEGPCPVVEELDKGLRSSDVAAEDADGLRQRADLNIDTPVALEMVDGAPPLPAKDTARVRIVHHHDGAELLGDLAESGDRAQVAVHREHTVGDQQFALAGREVFHDAACGIDILVWEHFDRGATQAAAIDDARVVQLVGHDDVFFCEDRGHGAGIGRKSALKDHDGLDVLELGEPSFQLHVNLHGAGDCAHGARTRAKLSHRVQRGLAQPGMCGQSQIVVRRQIHDGLVVERRMGALFALENAQRTI